MTAPHPHNAAVEREPPWFDRGMLRVRARPTRSRPLSSGGAGIPPRRSSRASAQHVASEGDDEGLLAGVGVGIGICLAVAGSSYEGETVARGLVMIMEGTTVHAATDGVPDEALLRGVIAAQQRPAPRGVGALSAVHRTLAGHRSAWDEGRRMRRRPPPGSVGGIPPVEHAQREQREPARGLALGRVDVEPHAPGEGRGLVPGAVGAPLRAHELDRLGEPVVGR